MVLSVDPIFYFDHVFIISEYWFDIDNLLLIVGCIAGLLGELLPFVLTKLLILGRGGAVLSSLGTIGADEL
jgi:hypothetical protein